MITINRNQQPCAFSWPSSSAGILQEHSTGCLQNAQPYNGPSITAGQLPEVEHSWQHWDTRGLSPLFLNRAPCLLSTRISDSVKIKQEVIDSVAHGLLQQDKQPEALKPRKADRLHSAARLIQSKWRAFRKRREHGSPEEELPLFLRHGRPQVVAPHKRVWPGVQNSPEADPMHPGHAPFTGHWRLRVRVPKPDSGGLRDCEVRAILAGGFWEPSSPKPKQQGGGHRVPRTTGPMGSSDGTQSLVAPIGGSSSVSLFMQARMRAMTAEADAALEMLRWKSRHAARSMRSSATGASHAAGHALARLAALLLCCCSRQAARYDDDDAEGLREPMLGSVMEEGGHDEGAADDADDDDADTDAMVQEAEQLLQQRLRGSAQLAAVASALTIADSVSEFEASAQ